MADQLGSKRDEIIGAMIQTARKPQSQKWLADAMRDRGHKWSQSTVWAIEKGVQPLRVTEAVDLSEILAISFGEFAAESSDVSSIRRMAAEVQVHRVEAVHAIAAWMFYRSGLDYSFAEIADVLDEGALDHLKAKVMREIAYTTEDLLGDAEVEFQYRNDAAQDDLKGLGG